MGIKNEYNCPEITPGVFIDPGDAVYIADEQGEIVTWNYDEIVDTDGEAFTAALTAVALAASEGPEAVRANIIDKGLTLEDRVDKTSSQK